MSSAIKPPGSGGPPGAGSTPEVGGAGSGTVGRTDDGAFRAAIDDAGAGAVREPRAGATASSARADALRALADEVRSGRIDARTAIDRLVERALAGGPAVALPPARRAELEALLRSALEEDPTLAAMQRDLARGR